MLGSAIKTARKEKNLTQAELSAELGISTRHLKYIENSGQNPSYPLFQRIMSTLNLSAEMALPLKHKKP
jgi:transcriptional regulator with XRE-family HTH domain